MYMHLCAWDITHIHDTENVWGIYNGFNVIFKRHQREVSIQNKNFSDKSNK